MYTNFLRDDVQAPIGGMDINTAVQEVLKTASAHHGLARGLHEATKTLDKYVKLQCNAFEHLSPCLETVQFFVLSLPKLLTDFLSNNVPVFDTVQC